MEIGKKKLIAGTGDKLIGNRKWFIDLCTGRYEYVIDVFSLGLTRLSSILIYMESLNDLNNKLQWRLDTELTSSVRQLSFESLITTLFLLVYKHVYAVLSVGQDNWFPIPFNKPSGRCRRFQYFALISSWARIHGFISNGLTCHF